MTTTKPTLALAYLIEKGADSDPLRQMIADVENLCNASYGERSAERANSRTAIASGSGRHMQGR
jgi:hypothetical protein